MAEQINDRDTPVTPRGINHVVLHVRNMEESHHFWCDLLGFKQVGELKARPERPNPANMRFYSGVVDDVNQRLFIVGRTRNQIQTMSSTDFRSMERKTGVRAGCQRCIRGPYFVLVRHPY